MSTAPLSVVFQLWGHTITIQYEYKADGRKPHWENSQLGYCTGKRSPYFRRTACNTEGVSGLMCCTSYVSYWQGEIYKVALTMMCSAPAASTLGYWEVESRSCFRSFAITIPSLQRIMPTSLSFHDTVGRGFIPPHILHI